MFDHWFFSVEQLILLLTTLLIVFNVMNKTFMYSRFNLSVNIRVTIFFLLGIFYVLYMTNEFIFFEKFYVKSHITPLGLDVYSYVEPVVECESYTGILWFYYKYTNSEGFMDLLWFLEPGYASTIFLPWELRFGSVFSGDKGANEFAILSLIMDRFARSYHLILPDAMVVFIKYRYLINWRLAFEYFFIFSMIVLLLILDVVYKKNRNFSFEIPVVLLLFVLSCFWMINFHNLFYIYLSLEAQSFITIILLSTLRYSILANESLIKFYILNAFASALFVLGLSYIYGAAGTLEYHGLSVFYNFWLHDVHIGLSSLGIFCLFTAFMFKLGLISLNFWIPDVYQGSNYFIIIFISVFAKLPLFIVFYFVFYRIFFCFIPFIQPLVLFLAAISLITSIIQGLYQFDVKRMLAYSSIMNTSLLLMAISLNTVSGLEAFLFLFFCYFMETFSFLSFLYSISQVSFVFKLRHVTDFRLLNRYQLTHVFIVIFSLLSFAGVPPLLGFFGKWFLLTALIDLHYYVLTVIVLFSTVISPIIYIRILRFMFFNPKSYNDIVSYKSANYFFVLIIILALFFNIFFIFFLDTFHLYFHILAQAIFFVT